MYAFVPTIHYLRVLFGKSYGVSSIRISGMP